MRTDKYKKEKKEKKKKSKFLLFFILLLLIILLLFGLLFINIFKHPKEVEKKSIDLAEKTSLELFNNNFDKYDSYTYNSTFVLKSNKKEYKYKLSEEFSPEGLHVRNENIEEYIKHKDDKYIHYLEFDKDYKYENLGYADISILNQLKDKKLKENINEEEGISTYTDEINLTECYIYELHDFIRLITQKTNTKLTSTAKITYKFKDGQLESIEIDATDAAKKILENTNISKCKMTIKDINFVNGIELDIPDDYDDASKLKDKYKNFDTKKSKKKNKNKREFMWQDSYGTFSLNGYTFSLGSTKVNDLLDAGIDLRYSLDNGYYAISDSKDYIQFTVVNNSGVEATVYDCNISGIYYQNRGYNEIPYVGPISTGMSLDQIIEMFGEPTSQEDDWYYWSDTGTIGVKIENGVVTCIRI